jgi:hypothetical protein
MTIAQLCNIPECNHPYLQHEPDRPGGCKLCKNLSICNRTRQEVSENRDSGTARQLAASTAAQPASSQPSTAAQPASSQPSTAAARPRAAYILCGFVAASLVLAITAVVLNLSLPSAVFSGLPRQNVTITSNATAVTQTVETTPTPSLPLFIVLFGYMGSAAYVLKVTTAKIGAGNFQNSYIPFHIIRLLIGPVFAIITYFILLSGGFFGLTVDLTKVSPRFIQYVYAIVAFLTGYFVRQIVDVFTNLLNSVFHTASTTGGSTSRDVSTANQG